MTFKLWFMTKGIAYMGWIAWGIAVTFMIAIVKYKEVRKYFFWFALILVFVGTIIFLYIVYPFNWEVVYHTGAIR